MYVKFYIKKISIYGIIEDDELSGVFQPLNFSSTGLLLEINPDFLSRSLNQGFSGGEKKRNEIFQMAMLEPKVAILETKPVEPARERSERLSRNHYWHPVSRTRPQDPRQGHHGFDTTHSLTLAGRLNQLGDEMVSTRPTR